MSEAMRSASVAVGGFFLIRSSANEAGAPCSKTTTGMSHFAIIADLESLAPSWSDRVPKAG
jgi:hypothetical protein